MQSEGKLIFWTNIILRSRFLIVSILNLSSVFCSSVCPSVCMSHFFAKTPISYISAKNKDYATKPSGYDPWTLPRSSMTSRTTPSLKSSVRKPPKVLQVPPFWPPRPDTFFNFFVVEKLSKHPLKVVKSSWNC
jgi:hypothetical protein